MSSKPERGELHKMAEELHDKTNEDFISCFRLLKHADYEMAKAVKLSEDNFLHKTRLA